MFSAFLSALANAPSFRGRMRVAKYICKFAPNCWVRGRYGGLIKLHARDRTSVAGVFGSYDDVWDGLNDIREGMNFVDIGANAGVFTVAVALRVGPLGSVLAFEPNPEVFARLVENVTRNNLPNVTAMPIGISEKTGVAHFAVEGIHTGKGHISNEDGGKLIITGNIIKDFPELLLPVTSKEFYVKIDVEGHENSVVKSLEPLLAHRNCKKIVVEVSKPLLSRAEQDSASIYQSLRNHGFRSSVNSSAIHYNEIFVRG